MKTRDRNATAERQPLKFSQEDFQGRFGAGQVQTPLATMASVWMLSELGICCCWLETASWIHTFQHLEIKKEEKEIKTFSLFPYFFFFYYFLIFLQGRECLPVFR